MGSILSKEGAVEPSIHGSKSSVGSNTPIPTDQYEHSQTVASNKHIGHEPNSLRSHEQEKSLVMQHDQEETNSDQENPSKTARTIPDAEFKLPEQSVCQQTLLSLLNQNPRTLDLGEVKELLFTHGPGSRGPRTTLIVIIED